MSRELEANELVAGVDPNVSTSAAPSVAAAAGQQYQSLAMPLPSQTAAAPSYGVEVQPYPSAIQTQQQQQPRQSQATAAAASTSPTGSKRTLITTDKDGNQLSAKKLRRLEKNRLSARECRRRKREATENLQREINLLEGENLRLRLQLQIGEEAEETMTREQTKLTDEINALLKSGASEAEIYAALESFKEKYADYGRDRRSAIEFHLRNVERLLMPTQTTSVVMAAIEGGSLHTPDDVATDAASSTNDSKPPPAASAELAAAVSTETNASVAAAPSDPPIVSVASPSSVSTMDSTKPFDPKTLFSTLVSHLEVSPEQAAALKDSRLVAKELDSYLEKALKLVTELRNRLSQTGENMETEFNNVRNVLTPTQAAKFLVWVANNGAAMHMLNELWERIYPQQKNNNSKLAVTPSPRNGDDGSSDDN
mmetsp:Transcript_25420/g.70217  ORF Transcript_25420/g.70217 Transcript_25420/m.70217 type:complete len:426 (-) Transcript_25420:73-1350(-)|eukprot:CAMPEP_0168736828 /NCGR_PEP_ID=MMETSP0724-20121128/10063_1 /TAXON_ID=265536 /ORGANISM="Amphiprora sp., Strain CCMP467" /LENGTH=425 /DNA_ID=CAMNT_0008784041 /DNA_START=71 /DNA_END=1348 /DNA_ORIENTATION=-